MIDRKLLIKDLQGCIEKLMKKGFEKEPLLKAHQTLLNKNKATEKVENLRSQKNQLSLQIADFIAKKDRGRADQLKEKVNLLKAELKKENESLIPLEESLEKLLLNIPNFPDEKAPAGDFGKTNVEICRENFNTDFFHSKNFPPHWKIMEELDLFDQARAGKITGSMFAILKGSGAKLMRSLLNFSFDIFEKEYTEFVVPSLVNSASMRGTGHLPKFSDEAYHIERDDLWAIPTGEVPLTALHREEIIDEKTLPLNYMTYTPCFRREAGAAGQENRGLQRLHEFHKLELVKICKASHSQQELKSLLQSALKPIKQLQLPYRVLDLCAGDLTFSSARTYDIEVYSPGTQSWLEVSSVSLFTDYQSRRSRIRYREDKKIFYPHTLNGSGLATPRVLASILENGWEKTGKVRLPSVLVKYMGREYL